jgi:hypothetical protein
MILNVLVTVLCEDLDSIEDLLEIGSEQVCITFSHSEKLVLYLCPESTTYSGDILEREE